MKRRGRAADGCIPLLERAMVVWWIVVGLLQVSCLLDGSTSHAGPVPVLLAATLIYSSGATASRGCCVFCFGDLLVGMQATDAPVDADARATGNSGAAGAQRSAEQRRKEMKRRQQSEWTQLGRPRVRRVLRKGSLGRLGVTKAREVLR